MNRIGLAAWLAVCLSMASCVQQGPVAPTETTAGDQCATEEACDLALRAALNQYNSCSSGYDACLPLSRDADRAQAKLDAIRGARLKRAQDAQRAKDAAEYNARSQTFADAKAKAAADEADRTAAYQAQLKATRELREKQAAHNDELKARANHREYALPVLSAMACRSKERLADAKASLSRERKIGAMSGAVDLEALHSAGEAIQDETDYATTVRAFARKTHKAELSACDGRYAELVACRTRVAAKGASCNEPLSTQAEIWDRNLLDDAAGVDHRE